MFLLTYRSREHSLHTLHPSEVGSGWGVCGGPEGPHLDDGRDELLQEGVPEEGRPVVVEEVDQQTFDVGAILILGHRTRAVSAPLNH